MKSKPSICRSRPNSKFILPRGLRAVLFALVSIGFQPVALGAQSLGQSGSFTLPDIPVLTIEPSRLLAETQFGQKLTKEIEKRGTQLAAENRSIEAELAEAEGTLTGRREELSAEEFRLLADEFDARVTSVRSEQDEKARALGVLSNQAQRRFLQAIAPVLEELMNENGASVILDRRAVFLSTDASDVSSNAIARIDKRFAQGPSLTELLATEPDQSAVSQPETPLALPEQ
ncbi:OmpH family outer membrane protein [Planktotalea sp.]|uniref:OmpH family outer membrane protein n=1 Tax=Planktotalea sp. TaxID=2029877 RepID=UPI003D6BAA8C